MELLKIENLHANAEEKEILKGLNLSVNAGEIHVIMGPNGAGKSTLANVILSNPAYQKAQGKIFFEGEDITSLTTDKIAQKGIFMSFQTPEEIGGISTLNFIKTAKNKLSGQPVFNFELQKELSSFAKELDSDENLLKRDFNVGFSGGEKKKNEIMQLLSLKPKLAILDETDSGLDVDAIRLVSRGINLFKNESNAVLIITHSTKILQEINVDFVHVLVDGKIVASGNGDMAKTIEERGYFAYKKDGENGEN